MDKKLSQYDMVLAYLRKDGYNIQTKYTTSKNRFGSKVTYATYLYKEN